MKRKLFALTALLAMLVCGVAYAAANNSYTATYTSKATGSKSHPAPVGMTEVLKVNPPNSSDRGGYPLKEIDSTIGGLEAPNAKYFKTCTVSKINSAGAAHGWNSVCPKGSEVAIGSVTSVIGTAGTLSKLGAIECSLVLHVYNAGAGKLAYFFTVPSGACDGAVMTGDATAWQGTTKDSKGKLLNDVPEPADVSTDAGNLGLWGSLQSETLNWSKLTVKSHGKTYGFLESISCKAGKRTSSTKYTSTNGSKETSATVTSTTKC